MFAEGPRIPNAKRADRTVEKSVGRQNSLRMVATIVSDVSLATRAEIQSGSATNSVSVQLGVASGMCVPSH